MFSQFLSACTGLYMTRISIPREIPPANHLNSLNSGKMLIMSVYIVDSSLDTYYHEQKDRQTRLFQPRRRPISTSLRARRLPDDTLLNYTPSWVKRRSHNVVVLVSIRVTEPTVQPGTRHHHVEDEIPVPTRAFPRGLVRNRCL